MRVEILRSVLISGESVSAGSFIELSQTDANLLISSGKAVPSPAPVIEPAKVEAPVAKPAAAAKPQRKASPVQSTSSEA